MIDLVGAVEIYLDHAPAGVEPMRVHYSDLLRAGRPDLAEEMIGRASPTAATRARILQSLRMLDEYLAHVRALPTPLQRLNGIQPLVSAWVQVEQSRASSRLH